MTLDNYVQIILTVVQVDELLLYRLIMSFVIVIHSLGDWLAVVAHTQKCHDGGAANTATCRSFSGEFISQCVWAMAVGYGVYFGFCGYLEVSGDTTTGNACSILLLFLL